ncbi:MAG: hypothetical protein ABJB97_02675 [Acidobacteriota bacterium]
MSTESTHPKILTDEKTNGSLKLLAGGLAILVTALLLVGYTYFRNRHIEQTLAARPTVQTNPANTPKGPAKAHILVDEALLNGGQTIIGGTVKNISQESLSDLKVELELQRRRDGTSERMTIALRPSQLQPDQEGRYSLTARAQDYGSVRLVGLNGGPSSGLISYTTGLGQKRPPERLQPKVIIIPRPPPGKGEFLNSPDNPARVP